MALITLRQLLDHAAEHNYGVPAFNVNNLEQLRAIMEAANATDSPVIVQASAGARQYAGPRFLKHLMLAAVEEFPHIPICMHQDHGASPAVCQRSIQLGFTSVEGELGCLGSLESGLAAEEDGSGAHGKLSKEMMLTDPDEAARFVKATKIDALAIAIGTSHGAYKFHQPPTGEVLVMDRVKAIHRRIPDTHLVMHGSSSVPADLIQEINEFGGKIRETYGVPVSEIVEGIKHGVRKINIDTDLRLAVTGAIRRYFAKNPSEFDPRKYNHEAIEAMKVICKARYEAFGTAGWASKIKPLSVEKMAERYTKGELNPRVV